MQGNGTYSDKQADERMTAQYKESEKKVGEVNAKAARIEKLVYGKLGTGQLDAMGYPDFTVPLFRKYDDSVTSAIYYRNPRLAVRKRREASDVAKKRAEVEQRKLEYYVRETDLMYQISLAFAEVRTKGVGYVEAFWDENREFSRIKHAPFNKTYVDVDTDGSASVNDLMWVARKEVYGLTEAKERWPEFDFSETRGEPDVGMTERFHVGIDNMEPSNPLVSNDTLTRRVTVLKVYLRDTESASGMDSPQLANSPEIGENEHESEEPTWDGDHGEEEDHEVMYQKAKQVAYYEVRNEGLYLISKEKQDFVCDDFAVIPLRVTTDPRTFYSYPLLEPFYDIANQAAQMLRINSAQARKHAKSIHILDSEYWTQDEAKQLNDGPDHQFYVKEDLARAENSFTTMDLGEPKEFVTKTASLFYDLFRELSSLDALTLGGGSESKERSATGSALLDKRAERIARKMADEFQAFVDRVFRTISQLDRSLMTRTQVQKIVGEDLTVDEAVWPNKWEDDAILGEYDVVIESGSMRYVSEEQQVQDMNNLQQSWVQFLAQIPDMQQGLGPKMTAMLIESQYRMLIRQAELLGVPNPEEFLVPADQTLAALQEKADQDAEQQQREAEMQAQAAAAQSQGQAQPPVMPQPGTPGPEVPQDITPQAASEQADMILAGTMDVEQAHPMAQMMAAKRVAEQQAGQAA